VYHQWEYARNQWDKDNDAAIGSVNLRTAASLHNIGTAATSSRTHISMNNPMNGNALSYRNARMFDGIEQMRSLNNIMWIDINGYTWSNCTMIK
jgi:hypothetical protein